MHNANTFKWISARLSLFFNLHKVLHQSWCRSLKNVFTIGKPVRLWIWGDVLIRRNYKGCTELLILQNSVKILCVNRSELFLSIREATKAFRTKDRAMCRAEVSRFFPSHHAKEQLDHHWQKQVSARDVKQYSTVPAELCNRLTDVGILNLAFI